jgi:hypothetical protein
MYFEQLTDEFLQALPAHTHPKMYTDGKGLHIFVSGKKPCINWRVHSRIKGKHQQVWTNLRNYPEISIAEARYCRDLIKAYARNGIDPRTKAIVIYARLHKHRRTKVEKLD